MDYKNYSTESSSVHVSDNSNDSYLSYGCSQSDAYDWLSDIVMPHDYKVCNIIEIKFKGSRKEFYLNDQNIYLKKGELAAVEGTMGGYDVGQVSLTGELVRMQLKKKNMHTEEVCKKVYRLATVADVTKWKLAKEMELDALYKARVIAKALNLSMKITDVDYQGDKSKATFYYTAGERVDFRQLIIQLCETLHIRIDMRHIGMREEAHRIGDIGVCGSYYCCQTWSTNFRTDSPFSARSQNNYRREGNKFECYIKDETINIDGSNIDEIKDKTQVRNKAVEAKPLSYANVVGQDSITRFDDKDSKRKRNNTKNRKRKHE